MILLNKIIRNIRDYGVFIFLQKSLLNIFKPLFVRWTYLIYVVDLNAVKIRKPVQDSGITFRFLNVSESGLIAQIETMEEWLAGTVVQRLERGEKCLIALQEEAVVGFNLLGFDRIHIPLVKISKSLRPHECFSVQITVHHKLRGKGLGTDLRHFVFASMKEAGYRRIYGGTQITNIANKALTRKVGFREFAVATYARIVGIERLKISRVKK